MVRVAINGFGRIGRLFLRSVFERGFLGTKIDVAAVADVSTDPDYLAYQLAYDSIHGRLRSPVSSRGDYFIIEGHEIKSVAAEQKPRLLPWHNLDIDIVIESTGIFTDGEKAAGHLEAGARQVIISAPAQGDVKTLVMGVNHHEYDAGKDHVISSASCTTHCLALPIHVLLKEGIGIESGMVTAVNSYTGSQRVVDGISRRDRRSGRSAGTNIIPSQTNAAKLAWEIFPALKERLSGISFRVPTADVSVVDLAFRSERNASIELIDGLMKKASQAYLKGYLEYCTEELVSSDFIHDAHSSIYDSSVSLQSNIKEEKRQFRIVAWYDNEWGYANRLVDLVLYMAGKGLV